MVNFEWGGDWQVQRDIVYSVGALDVLWYPQRYGRINEKWMLEVVTIYGT